MSNNYIMDMLRACLIAATHSKEMFEDTLFSVATSFILQGQFDEVFSHLLYYLF